MSGFGIGGVFRTAYNSVRGLFSDRSGAGAAGTKTIPAPSSVTTDSIRLAGGALRSAFSELGSRMRPVYTTAVYKGLSSSATVDGLSARIAPVAGANGYAVMATNLAINTQTSTVRSSTAAIGLSMSSASSSLASSAALGLDMTATASVLKSGKSWDVTTAEAYSVNRSSGSIGLDLATPQAVSTIQSTAEMNTGFNTSYGSSTLTFRNDAQTQTSSSVGTLTGTYTGTGAAANATSLSFEITGGDTIGGGLLGLGEGHIKFKVKDQTGATLFTYEAT
jgi:hypothetical protein